MEDEVRELLRDGASFLEVVAEDRVHDAKVGRGAVGEMADHEAVGFASVLVHQHEVGHFVGSARLDELLEHVVTAVQFLCIGEHQTQLFDELVEARGGIARSGDDKLRISDAGTRVLVVDALCAM